MDKHIQNKKNLGMAVVNVAIPEALENLQLPDPSLLQFYKNYNSRIIWIDDEISYTTLEFAKFIMQWNFDDEENGIPPEERVPIKILFFSPGGDLDVNNCLVDVISMSKTKVIGINAGEAASSGCFIYLACHERYTFPNASFLIHQGAGSFNGTYEQVVSAIIDYQRQIEELRTFILSRTEIPEELFNDKFSTDWYLSAKDAVRYGVAHKIIRSLDEIFI